MAIGWGATNRKDQSRAPRERRARENAARWPLPRGKAQRYLDQTFDIAPGSGAASRGQASTQLRDKFMQELTMPAME